MYDDYFSFLGPLTGSMSGPTPAPQQAPVLDPSYAAMIQPQPDFSAAQKPAASPQDLERRMHGWAAIAHKFQTDPNLQRAMMMTGAAMMQPIQPGQTVGGANANAAVVGMNAYSMGQEADFAKQVAAAKEGRAERGLDLEARRVEEGEATGATNRASTEAKTEGTLLDTQIAKEGKEDLLKRGQALAEEAVAKLKDFKDAEGARKAERAITEQDARIRNSIPDKILQQAKLDELNAVRAKFDQIRATTAGTEAKTEGQRLENEGQASISPALRAAATGSGGNTSSDAQMRNYTYLYNSTPELQKKYPNVGSYIDERMSGKKKGTAMEDLATFNKASEKFRPEDVPQDMLNFFLEQVRRESGMPGSNPTPAPAAADGKGKKPPPKTGEVVNGHKWKGPANPTRAQLKDPANWEKVQ